MTKWTEIFAKSGEDDSGCLIGDINEFIRHTRRYFIVHKYKFVKIAEKYIQK